MNFENITKSKTETEDDNIVGNSIDIDGGREVPGRAGEVEVKEQSNAQKQAEGIRQLNQRKEELIGEAYKSLEKLDDLAERNKRSMEKTDELERQIEESLKKSDEMLEKIRLSMTRKNTPMDEELVSEIKKS